MVRLFPFTVSVLRRLPLAIHVAGETHLIETILLTGEDHLIEAIHLAGEAHFTGTLPLPEYSPL